MSSVPNSRRNLSNLEFYRTATRLRREITALLLRDFGVKDKVRNTKIVAKEHRMTPEDEEALKALLEKYGIEKNIIDEYPDWLIDKMRSSIMDILRNLILNIRAANIIYPTSEAEFFERRIRQDRAIGNCEQLDEEMQYIISVIPVDAQKYMRYTDMIEKEEALLRGWRKSDNKILTRIRKEEKKRSQQNKVVELLTDILNVLKGWKEK